MFIGFLVSTNAFRPYMVVIRGLITLVSKLLCHHTPRRCLGGEEV